VKIEALEDSIKILGGVSKMDLATPTFEAGVILGRLGVPEQAWNGGALTARSPITGEVIGAVRTLDSEAAKTAIDTVHQAFLAWRTVPAPRRGELIRLFGEELRAAKGDLGRLVTLEAGKIVSEGLGEVQEMIDICDFAVGLSRQLYGRTIATERADHRMMETWQPIGVTGIISAFNFPVAVWAWNAALALVCGNAVVWKPSEKTPLTALATQALFMRAAARFGEIPAGLSTLLIGDKAIGEVLVDHPRIAVLSATGSTRMGREVGPRLAKRFARSILELGGNNAAIVAASAKLDLALRAIVFSAMGTAGQRCTTLRRLFVHDSVYDALVPKLKHACKGLKIGDPRSAGALIGPLIDQSAFAAMQAALESAEQAGGLISGGKRAAAGPDSAFYVEPAIVEMPSQSDIVRHETFAPILYVMRYSDLDEAIRLQNDVPQGLSSSIFTMDLAEAEIFVSAVGSDCGIANVNIGPSGAEIGGAFGGEKETGGGRESGSDSWKAYMRRVTTTVNYGKDLPLAQGVEFPVD
jgi:aldehyde dehydrogenase (NAD+)